MEALSTRETASLAWIGLLLLFGLWKLKLGPLLLASLRSFAKPMVLRAIAVMALYVAGSVWVLGQLKLWELANLKATLVWFVTFVLGWIFDLKRWDADPNEAARATLRDVFKLTAFVTFLTEFYTLNLVGELILLPVACALTIIGMVANEKSRLAPISDVTNLLLGALGLGLLGNALFQLVTNFTDFATASTGRDFAMPGLLSLLFLPFMYAFNVYVAYDATARLMPLRLQKAGLSGYALRTAVLSFGLRVKLLRRWRTALFNVDAESREEVKATIVMMKAAYAREQNPPAVAAERGWSPYLAVQWLDAQGLNAGLYNPRYREWRASSHYKKLTDDIRGDNLAYYVAGIEAAATELTLVLNLNNRRPGPPPEASVQAFIDAATPLMTAAFGDKATPALRGLKNKSRRTQQGFAIAVLKEDADRLRLIITHKAHIEPTY